MPKALRLIQGVMPAIAKSLPCMRSVREPDTGDIVQHLAYDAEMQYKSKPNQVRLILCNSLDEVRVDEPVLVTYHSGMRAYQHDMNVSTSTDENCIGDFYYTDGRQA